MNINAKAVIKASALYTAMGVLLGGAWAFGDNTGYRPWLKKEMQEFTARDFQKVMDQTQQNTLAITKNEFDLLWGQRTHGELDFDAKVKLCTDAYILKYSVTDEEGNLICTAEGAPILTARSTVK